MPTLRSSFFAAAVALVTAWSSSAAADIPPPDLCSGGVGTPCTNAGTGENPDQPGICVASTCTHPEPLPDGGQNQYPCILCESGEQDGGSGASSSSSSSGTGATSSSSTSSSSSTGATSSSSTSSTGAGGGASSSGVTPAGGCTVGAVPGEKSMAGAMLVAGLGLLASRRRRRG